MGIPITWKDYQNCMKSHLEHDGSNMVVNFKKIPISVEISHISFSVHSC